MLYTEKINLDDNHVMLLELNDRGNGGMWFNFGDTEINVDHNRISLSTNVYLNYHIRRFLTFKLEDVIESDELIIDKSYTCKNLRFVSSTLEEYDKLLEYVHENVELRVTIK